MFIITQYEQNAVKAKDISEYNIVYRCSSKEKFFELRCYTHKEIFLGEFPTLERAQEEYQNIVHAKENGDKVYCVADF